MPQIFHRSMNVVSRVSILGAVFLLAGIAWAWGRWVRSDYMTGVGNVRVQPIEFSHRHHVSGLGIDCRYCHTAVEEGPFAGLPPTRTCMNCHSQIFAYSPMLARVRDSYRTGEPIRWQRVHNLADFAYFDHSIHVAKGIGCSTCHGRVDHMPLTWQTATLHMEWCLECHRQPERFVRPRDEIYNMAWRSPPDQIEQGLELLKRYHVPRGGKLTDCSTCHR
ncbi:MAG: cytochrome c family protein [Gemmataceae bacterium]|nr:cytochrome c family protein [Gemmataceae bacterium]